MATSRLGPRIGGWRRPESVPANLACLRGPLSGRVGLPLSLYSSGRGPERVFDLGDERERMELYEVVFTEGTADEVCRYIDLEELQRLWPKLWLPQHFRHAWEPRLPPAPVR